jgi:hypothetical protein
MVLKANTFRRLSLEYSPLVRDDGIHFGSRV